MLTRTKLAVILHADVVGSTSLVRQDERTTHERIRDAFKRFAECISSYGGTTHEIRGDALVAEFERASDAVSAALSFQAENAVFNDRFKDGIQPILRVGISLGEVIIADDTLTGTAVVIAQRLEQLADPGGVIVQLAASDTIPRRFPYEYVFLGEHDLKGFDEPMSANRVELVSGASIPAPEGIQNGNSADSATDPDSQPSSRPSIAVLPFENMSGDQEQEYFSDGISEDLITELSHFKELSVVSRNSSFSFKGAPVVIGDVAGKLGVQYLVEGSIRKAGNRVRITVQLIDANQDNHIWADRYDRELEDIFAVQDDVVRRIVSTLVGRLEHARQEGTRRLSISQLQAYDLYLHAREQFFTLTREDNLQAGEKLESALAIEPNYAAALALISEVLLRNWLNGWTTGSGDLLGALDAASRAVEIDDQDSRVHTALGLTLIFHRELEKARHHFETAMSLNPNDTRVRVYYSRQAVFDGHFDRALELSEQALTLNPFGKYAYNIAIANFAARRYQEAVDRLETIGNPPATLLALLAASHTMQGNKDKARETCTRFHEARRACPGLASLETREDWRQFISERWPFRNPEDTEHVLEAFARAGISAQ